MTKKNASLQASEEEIDNLEKGRRVLTEQLNKLLDDPPTVNKTPKVIRDSFTLPENDYNLIRELQDRGLGLRMHITKGELLRAGLHALEDMSDDNFVEIMKTVEKLKPGRRKET
ncbi:MAG: hypothetical protein AAF512_11215 [Pseudomonadota bacterium]